MDRKPRLSIQLQDKNPAGPGTIDHPHPVLFIIKYRWVYSIGILFKVIFPQGSDIIFLCIVLAHIVKYICLCHLLYIGKSGVDKSSLPLVRPLRSIGNGVAEVRSIPGGSGTKIHKIFSLRFIVNHIRCPHMPASVIGGNQAFPASGICKCLGVFQQFTINWIFNGIPVSDRLPIFQIVCHCPGHMGTKYVISSILSFYDGRVMDTDSRIYALCRNALVAHRKIAVNLFRENLVRIESNGPHAGCAQNSRCCKNNYIPFFHSLLLFSQKSVAFC